VTPSHLGTGRRIKDPTTKLRQSALVIDLHFEIKKKKKEYTSYKLMECDETETDPACINLHK
jgi:hypothetical protein